MTVLILLLGIAVIYLWHRIDGLESRVAVTEAGHRLSGRRRLAEVLLSTKTEDMLTFVLEPGWPPEQRADLAASVVELLRDRQFDLTPEARCRLADAIAGLLRCKTISAAARATLVHNLESLAKAASNAPS